MWEGRNWSSGGEVWWEGVFSAVAQFVCNALNLQALITVHGGKG
jgi:hypothetical protein